MQIQENRTRLSRKHGHKTQRYRHQHAGRPRGRRRTGEQHWPAGGSAGGSVHSQSQHARARGSLDLAVADL